MQQLQNWKSSLRTKHLNPLAPGRGHKEKQKQISFSFSFNVDFLLLQPKQVWWKLWGNQKKGKPFQSKMSMPEELKEYTEMEAKPDKDF